MRKEYSLNLRAKEEIEKNKETVIISQYESM